MKQYTTPDQTAKLIELGFTDSIREERYKRGSVPKPYSIGELIEMLPKDIDCEIGDIGLTIENNIYETPNEWMISYDSRHITNSIELIDALFNMIIMLKEEGVV